MDFANTAPNVLSIVSVGMALAFVLSDRRSMSSRMLAAALVSIGVSIFANTNWVEPVDPADLPPWSGLCALADALALMFSAQWLLYIRRTIPAGNLDTRAGDWLVRWAQGFALLYLLASLAAPELRATVFLTSLDHWPPAFPPAFWLFATPVMLSMFSMALVIRLIMFRRPEPSEAIRLLGFFVGSPLIALGLILPPELAAYTTSTGLMSLLVGAVQYHVLEGQKGGFMKRFMAPQVADLVRREGLQHTMASDTLDISVVACDVRGFTRFAEAMPSRQVIQGLRSYYDRIGTIAARHGATIKDYAGDGVLMLLGAPVASAAHADAAVALACDLRREVAPLLASWSVPDLPLGMGIGVATGEATVGIVGSVSRLEYAAVGSVVNRAARLCDAAAPGQILLDAACRAAVAQPPADAQFEAEPPMTLKGFDETVAAYSIAAANP